MERKVADIVTLECIHLEYHLLHLRVLVVDDEPLICWTLRDHLADEGYSVADLLLSPTRTYAPPVKKILEEYGEAVHGIIHCTGGGQIKVLNFIRNLHVIKDRLFSPSPVFRLIREQSGTSLREMYQVFNMGHRLELYLPETHARGIIDIFKNHGIDAQIIGRTEPFEEKKVSLHTEEGVIEYL